MAFSLNTNIKNFKGQTSFIDEKLISSYYKWNIEYPDSLENFETTGDYNFAVSGNFPTVIRTYNNFTINSRTYSIC